MYSTLKLLGDPKKNDLSSFFGTIACLNVLIICKTVFDSLGSLGENLNVNPKVLSCGESNNSSMFGFRMIPCCLARSALTPPGSPKAVAAVADPITDLRFSLFSFARIFCNAALTAPPAPSPVTNFVMPSAAAS